MTGFEKAYDAGSVEVTITGAKVDTEVEVNQLLIYPTVDSFISLHGSTKEIFLPKNMWTPISISRDWTFSYFIVRSDEVGKVYWQGWVN